MRYAADLRVGEARWTLVPHDEGHGYEDLVLAVELDRVWARDLYRLGRALVRNGRSRAGWGRVWWSVLMDGAVGLRRADAPRRLAHWEACEQAGLEFRGFRYAE